MMKKADRDDEPVILLDPLGRASGTAPKQWVHGTQTPLHLGFSCHVFDRSSRVLLTRRSASKPTWPGVWTNACCGHPQPGETLRDAVSRRLRHELGVRPERMALALPDFTYRAVMPNGVVEHEVCPVVLAEIDGEPSLNADEAQDATWLDWDALCGWAGERPESLSPLVGGADRAADAARALTAGLDAPKQPPGSRRTDRVVARVGRVGGAGVRRVDGVRRPRCARATAGRRRAHVHQPWALEPDRRAEIDYPPPIVDREVAAARFRALRSR